MAKSVDKVKEKPLATNVRRGSGVARGLSTAQEDNLVPLIYVLQGLSPQVNKRNESYVDGAEPGDIWLRNAADPVVKGDQGIIFQPCFFNKDWVEWIPRENGGGFVGRHETLPATAKKVEDDEDTNLIRYVLPNGNEVKETRYHVGLVYRDNGSVAPFVIPFTGSGHTVSRQFMSMIVSKLDDGGQRFDAWEFKYKLTTKLRKNKKGEWFVFEPHDVGRVSDEEYAAGEALFKAFESGAKKAAHEDDVAGEENLEQAAM